MLVGALLGFMHTRRYGAARHWPFRISRQSALAVLIGIHLLTSTILRPRRLASVAGYPTSGIQDYDAWWELLGLVYTSLTLGNNTRY